MSRQITLNLYCIEKRDDPFQNYFQNYITIGSSFVMPEPLIQKFKDPRTTLGNIKGGELELMELPVELKTGPAEGKEVKAILSNLKMNYGPEKAGHSIQNIFLNIIQVCSQEKIHVVFSQSFEQNINFGLAKAAQAARQASFFLKAADELKKAPQTDQSTVDTVYNIASRNFDQEISRMASGEEFHYESMDEESQASRIAQSTHAFSDFFQFDRGKLLELAAENNKMVVAPLPPATPITSTRYATFQNLASAHSSNLSASSSSTPLLSNAPSSQQMKNWVSDAEAGAQEPEKPSSFCWGCCG